MFYYFKIFNKQYDTIKILKENCFFDDIDVKYTTGDDFVNSCWLIDVLEAWFVVVVVVVVVDVDVVDVVVVGDKVVMIKPKRLLNWYRNKFSMPEWSPWIQVPCNDDGIASWAAVGMPMKLQSRNALRPVDGGRTISCVDSDARMLWNVDQLVCGPRFKSPDDENTLLASPHVTFVTKFK